MKALVVENDPYWRTWFSTNLEGLNAGVAVHVADSVEKAKKHLDENADYDLIVCEQFLEDASTGMDLWRTLQNKQSKIPFLLTGAIPEPVFIEKTRASRTEEAQPLVLEKARAKEHFRRLVKQVVNLAPLAERAKVHAHSGVLAPVRLDGLDQRLQQVVDCFW